MSTIPSSTPSTPPPAAPTLTEITAATTTSTSEPPDTAADIPWPMQCTRDLEPIPEIIWSVYAPMSGKDPKYMQYPASILERHPYLLEPSSDEEVEEEGEKKEESGKKEKMEEGGSHRSADAQVGEAGCEP